VTALERIPHQAAAWAKQKNPIMGCFSPIWVTRRSVKKAKLSYRLISETAQRHIRSKLETFNRSTHMNTPDLQGEYTGRYLLVGKPNSAKETLASIRNSSGLTIASSRDFDGQAVSAEALDQADGIYFDEIGVSVVSPQDADQFNRLNGAALAQALDDDDQPMLEPERVVHAIEENFGDYLRGFRDAIDTVSEKYTSANGGASAQEMVDALANGSTWGLQKTRTVVSFPFSQTRTGAGIKVAVLDTGMDLNHPDFAGRGIISQSFVPGQAVQDGNSHGTHCIGTACGPLNPSDPTKERYGVAHKAQIFAGKVLNNAGSGADGWILAGINWAIAQGCHVISMSLGAPVTTGGFSNAYENAALAAFNANCLIVAAAGNLANAPVGHPANCPSIMAVGAVDQNLVKAGFSSITHFPPHGKVDITGPGVGTFSSVPVSHGTYGIKSGTSMATPHVAGIAALHAQVNPAFRGAALWQRLIATSLALPAQPATHVGAGLVQAPYRRRIFNPAPFPLPHPLPKEKADKVAAKAKQR
jgi:subtilisin